ncbi:MAG TPA: ABC transporter ATP-binding protein, partial [Candidatus Baltobacteraceae bacterium]|nr:ABC transporter ATP-binding protein [Candidatus Baltobacteraceae bacterium]
MAEALLAGRGLTKRFGGLWAVRDVDFGVAEREILGLIGPNGAGKSTLFALIAGILRPSAGRVVFAGRDITKLRPASICVEGVVATHQIVRPFRALSVLENVLVGAFYGRRPRPHGEDARKFALQSLTTCGLAERAEQPASALNLAGQKRLEIARALATNPRVLLLDEVLAGLNATETDRTLDLVRSIRDAGTTIVMVEHNLRAVRGVCSRLMVLVHGIKV